MILSVLLPSWLAITVSYGLRLHSEPLTPLKLSLKLGKDNFAVGCNLMTSLNISKSHESFLSLMKVKTLLFRLFLQAKCQRAFPSAEFFLDTARTFAVDHRADLIVGIECMQLIPGIGAAIEELEFKIDFEKDVVLTSQVRLKNFTPNQISSLIRQTTHPTNSNNVLSSNFLCQDLGYHLHLFENSPLLLDGQMISKCPNLAISLVDRLVIVDGVDLREADEIEIEKLLSSPRGIFHLIANILQLTALHNFIQNYLSKRANGFTYKPTLQHIKRSFLFLTIPLRQMEGSSSKHKQLLKIIFELAKYDLHKADNGMMLVRHLREAQKSSILGVYDLVNQFSGSLIKEEMDREIGQMIQKSKINCIILFVRHSISGNQLDELIKDLLEPNHFGPVPVRCLLDLLCIIDIQRKFQYTTVCRTIVDFILRNMNVGSDVSGLVKLNMDKYFPSIWKYSLVRQHAAWLHEGSNLELEKFAEYIEGSEKEGIMKEISKSEYIDVEHHRRRTSEFICRIIKHNFVYIAHSSSSSLPVYVPSLVVHPLLHSLFLRLLLHANALRLILPFEIHPCMSTLMSNHAEEGAYFRLADLSFRHEFSRFLNEDDLAAHLARLSALIHQAKTFRAEFRGRSVDLESLYFKWLSDSKRFLHSNEMHMDQVYSSLKHSSTHLLGFSLAKVSFNHLLGLSICPNEGMNLILNHEFQ